MNNPSLKMSRRRNPWYLRISSWAIGFVVLLGVFAIAMTWIEVRASQKLRQAMELANKQGVPYDNASMTAWFDKNSSHEQTQEWTDILLLSTTGSQAQKRDWLLYHSPGANVDVFTLKQDEYDELRHELVVEAKPFLDRVHSVQRSDKPVWFPIKFAGYGTLLHQTQDSRSVMRWLELELEDALKAGDRQRASECLDAMDKTASAFDCNLCTVTRLVSIAHWGVYWQSIRQSLAGSFWNKDELEQLLKRVDKPRNVDADWNEITQGELAFVLETIGNYDSEPQLNMVWHALRLPSIRHYVWEQYSRLSKVSNGGYSALATNSKTYDQSVDERARTTLYGFIVSRVHPSSDQIAKSLLREEMLRKLTKTAIALKRFRLDQHEWPKNLTELAGYGLETDDWMATESQAFGYELEPDGNSVVLWGTDQTGTLPKREQLEESLAKAKSLDYRVKISDP
jgi:hypothetical protein